MPASAAGLLQPFAVETARLTLWLLLLTMVFVPLEHFFAIERQPRLRKGLGADLLLYFCNGLLIHALLAVPVAALAALLRHLLPDAVLQATAGLPFWPRVAAALLVGEIGFYWGHRWSHEIPLLWRFHSVHHSPETLDWLVNTRAHPVDLVFTRLCGFVPVYALGLGQAAASQAGLVPVLVMLLGTLWGFFVHANLRWRFGWLEHVVASPAFHRWHHTADAFRDRNYASVLSWLDRLFGTWHLPKGRLPAGYGIGAPLPAERPAAAPAE